MISYHHHLYDDRIYWKEALSLINNGYQVICINTGPEYQKGITRHGIDYITVQQKKIFHNIFLDKLFKIISGYNIYRDILNRSRAMEADIYHMHDLCLNKIGRKLKNFRHKPKVIYDVHEPFPENIEDYYSGKNICIKLLKKLYARYIYYWELKCAKYYDLVITTEENVNQKFIQKLGKDKVDIIYNYTDLKPDFPTLPDGNRIYDVIYCGGITTLRGAMQLLKVARITASSIPDIKFLLVGTILETGLMKGMEKFIIENKLEKNIIVKETVPYEEIKNYYSKSKIGIALFMPVKTHHIILPIKTFEYMSFGLPIVCSNFGHLAKYVTENDVGEVVNPENIQEIANAILKILNNRELYVRYSENGIKAVKEKYNWKIMENKLVNIYHQLLYS
jgi:glycosyltransferase involved in cell wall biosynthesis